MVAWWRALKNLCWQIRSYSSNEDDNKDITWMFDYDIQNIDFILDMCSD